MKSDELGVDRLARVNMKVDEGRLQKSLHSKISDPHRNPYMAKNKCRKFLSTNTFEGNSKSRSTLG